MAAVSLGKTTSFASKTIKNISNILLNKTATKKNISSNILRYKDKRNENDRRIRAQNELFASSTIKRVGGSISLSLSQVGGSFLSRIVQFAGFVTTGWLLNNMPTWIAGARELSNRIQSLNSTFTGFVDNIWEMMSDIGRISTALFENMRTFDLTDSSYRVRNSMTGLIDTLDSMGDQIKEAFSVLTEPFMNVPPPGTEAGPGAYPDVKPEQPSQPSPSGGGGNRYGTKEERALLDAIAYAEGNTNWSTWAGYQKHGPNDLTGLTIRQVYDLQSTFISSGKVKKTGSAVVGRYQFKDLLYHAKGAGLNPETDKFSPENQDKMAIASAKRRGVDDSLLKKEGLSIKVADMLAPEWASFPYSPKGGRSYYGQGFKNIKNLQKVYQQSLGSTTQQQSSPSTAKPSTQQKTNLDLNKLGFFVGEKAGYSPSRGRIHAGRDIAIASGTPVYTISDATITDVGFDRGGYGYYVAYVDSQGIEHFYGHLREMSKAKKGQKLSAGTVVGYVGSTGRSTGPHLHWEVSPRIGEVGRPRKNVIDPIKYGFSSSAPFRTSSQSTSSTPLIPSSTSPTSQVARDVAIQPSSTDADLLSEILKSANLAAKRQDIVLINDLQPLPTQMPGGFIRGGGGSPSMGMSEGELVNSFIKNKLLLDLNYL